MPTVLWEKIDQSNSNRSADFVLQSISAVPQRKLRALGISARFPHTYPQENSFRAARRVVHCRPNGCSVHRLQRP